MTQALALSQPSSLAPVSLEQKVYYAAQLAKANLLPKHFANQPGNVLMAMELGEALNIKPIVAILQVHVIEGKPGAGATLVASLVRRAGHKLRIVATPQEATCTIIRSDDPEWPVVVRWTLDMARAAGLLNKDNWKKYPEDMLAARAMTACARRACPEVLCGVEHSPEELGSAEWHEGSGSSLELVDDLPKVDPSTEKQRYKTINTAAPEPTKKRAKADKSAVVEAVQAELQEEAAPADAETCSQTDAPADGPKACSQIDAIAFGYEDDDMGRAASESERQRVWSTCKAVWPENTTQEALKFFGGALSLKNATLGEILAMERKLQPLMDEILAKVPF